MSSAGSSGKFSFKNIVNNGASTGVIMEKEPLEMMVCPSHEGQLLNHYSINIREFMCRECLREIEGTQKEIDTNALPVDESIRVLESRLSMQTLVNLDEKIRGILDLVKKKKDFCLKDKEESLKMVNKQFDLLYKKLEERKTSLFQKIIAVADQESTSFSLTL